MDFAVTDFSEYLSEYNKFSGNFLEFTKMEYVLIYYLDLLTKSRETNQDYNYLRKQLIIFFNPILIRPGSWSQSNYTLYLALKKFTFERDNFSLSELIPIYRNENFKPFKKTYFQFIQSELLIKIAFERNNFSSLINEFNMSDIYLPLNSYTNETMNIFNLTYGPFLLLYASLGLSIFDDEAQAIAMIDSYYQSYASKNENNKIGLWMLLNLKNLLKIKPANYYKSILDSHANWKLQVRSEALELKGNIAFDFCYLLSDKQHKFPFSKENFKLRPLSNASDSSLSPTSIDDLAKNVLVNAINFICNRNLEAQN